ncbi:hypothetical protein LR48_Vigan11g072300 [Vigna angularis]|uniref:Uncharacterized protein n=1 Tax=Phaseolus angularis TaxID=3914 RepID=A0A0L9VRI9_PHAAN|nr:hypothetical protein LR48_Vigan11g072300 [Vigna angularis]
MQKSQPEYRKVNQSTRVQKSQPKIRKSSAERQFCAAERQLTVDKIRKFVLGVHDHQEKKDKEGRRACLGAPLRALITILQVSCSPSSVHEVVKNIKENGVIEIEAPYSRRHLLMDVGQHLLRDARRTQMTASTDGCCYDENDE